MHLAACCMSVRIVDALEVIYIDQVWQN
jgi:hypothetical protein